MRNYTRKENRRFLFSTVLLDRIEDIVRYSNIDMTDEQFYNRTELFKCQIDRIYRSQPFEKRFNRS